MHMAATLPPPALQILQPRPRPVAQLHATHTGPLRLQDADYGANHITPGLALTQLQTSPSSTTVAGGVVPPLPPVPDPRTTLITEAPTAIAQPPVATAGLTIESTAGEAPTAWAAQEAGAGQ